MNIFKNMYCVISCFVPFVLIYKHREDMFLTHYIIAGILICVQFYCVYAFYLTRNKWRQWIISRVSTLDFGLSDIVGITLATDAFFLALTLIFGCLFPYSLYLSNAISVPEYFLVFNLSIFTWYSIYHTPLYPVLSGESGEVHRVLRAPFSSMFFLLFNLFVNPLPFDRATIMLITLGIFCFELMTLIGIKIVLNMEKINVDTNS